MVKFAVETNLSVENINTDQIRIIGFLFRETKHASVEKGADNFEKHPALEDCCFYPVSTFWSCGCIGVQISSKWEPLVSSHPLL